MPKKKYFSLNKNNWLLLVVFVLSSFFSVVEPFVVLAGVGIVVNVLMVLACCNRENWNEEAFKRNLAEAAIDDKIASLVLWTLIWIILLRFGYNSLVMCSVLARSWSGIFVRIS
jgi:hypothetical protein